MLIPFIALMLVACLSSPSVGTTSTLAVPQIWQHKDTNMPCIPGGYANIHASNAVHVLNCPHCKMYCAPAACAMVAAYAGKVAPFTNQDDIYDVGKTSLGEISGDGVLQTHGVGMFVGIGGQPAEIQGAFTYSVGVQPYQHGPVADGFPMITAAAIISYIDHNEPVLWVDVANWPADMDSIPPGLYYESGHCKVIAGYSDADTVDPADDTFLIFDPWPTSGSSYWQAQIQVIDPTDVYLTTTAPIATGESTWGGIKNLFDK
ncbi:MAG: C39 family peptidase [Candidatus Krumholzibacteria bacterium]|nr:C39 family peptidase [Candidatus Krumholzibacteria bacterium]